MLLKKKEKKETSLPPPPPDPPSRPFSLPDVLNDVLIIVNSLLENTSNDQA